MLQQVEDRLTERGAMLVFSCVAARAPTGRDLRRYFQDMGLAQSE